MPFVSCASLGNALSVDVILSLTTIGGFHEGFRLTVTGDWQLSFDVELKGSGVFLPSTDGNLGSLQNNDYNICYTMGIDHHLLLWESFTFHQETKLETSNLVSSHSTHVMLQSDSCCYC